MIDTSVVQRQAKVQKATYPLISTPKFVPDRTIDEEDPGCLDLSMLSRRLTKLLQICSRWSFPKLL